MESLQRVKFKRKKHERIKVVYKDKRKADWKCPECGNGRLVVDENQYITLWD